MCPPLYRKDLYEKTDAHQCRPFGAEAHGDRGGRQTGRIQHSDGSKGTDHGQYLQGARHEGGTGPPGRLRELQREKGRVSPSQGRQLQQFRGNQWPGGKQADAKGGTDGPRPDPPRSERAQRRAPDRLHLASGTVPCPPSEQGEQRHLPENRGRGRPEKA